MRCSGFTKQGAMCKNHAGSSVFCRHHRLPPIKEVSSLPDADRDEDEICPICLLIVLNIDRFTLGCSHVFCKACIFEWLKKKRSCPVCRAIPLEQEIDLELTAPADGRVYDDSGLPMDWTEEEAIFDLVESLHTPSFPWDDPGYSEAPTELVVWRFPFWS